ncbi:HPr kinase/phosphorylase [Roseicyclus sp.]|uniref:HPr kinase/phosphorylase n=1 Tax=Roseicyclus sp. TaxID=1914329 RepID=UPI003F9F5FE0
MDAAQPVALSDWAATRSADRLQLHATGVAVEGQGVLIRGRTGSGKSTLALELMARGAALICDDAIWVDVGDTPFLERPDAATDMIESRGIGLLRAGHVCGRAPLALAIDLDAAEADRLPPRRTVSAGGAAVPLIHGAGHPALATAVVHMLRHGRAEP